MAECIYLMGEMKGDCGRLASASGSFKASLGQLTPAVTLFAQHFVLNVSEVELLPTVAASTQARRYRPCWTFTAVVDLLARFDNDHFWAPLVLWSPHFQHKPEFYPHI